MDFGTLLGVTLRHFGSLFSDLAHREYNEASRVSFCCDLGPKSSQNPLPTCAETMVNTVVFASFDFSKFCILCGAKGEQGADLRGFWGTLGVVLAALGDPEDRSDFQWISGSSPGHPTGASIGGVGGLRSVRGPYLTDL